MTAPFSTYPAHTGRKFAGFWWWRSDRKGVMQAL